MTIETVSFIFGILLIGTALLGGGFQAKEVTVPKIGNASRIVCAFLGAGFIVLGIILNPTPKPANENESAALTSFHVINELGEQQVSEQVRVTFDGQIRGTITVSALHPQAELLVSVLKPGQHHYQLIANAVFVDEKNEPKRFDGGGEGYINVIDGAVYELEGDLSGGVWRATLIQR